MATDHDDAVFHRYDLHKSPIVHRLLGRKIDRVMEYSIIVFAGNAYLAARAHAAGARRIKAIGSLPSDPGLRCRMGAAGRETVERDYLL